MRHRNVWAAGLALGLSIGVTGIALGQDPSPAGKGPGLLDKLFASATAPFTRTPTDSKKELDGRPAPVTPAVTRAQALNDYLRRMQVCDRLRAIAEENGDGELKNRALVLETRAKDIYLQRTNVGGMTPAEESLEQQLAPQGRTLTPLTSTSKTGGSAPAFAGGR